jgi:hypothetical protein
MTPEEVRDEARYQVLSILEALDLPDNVRWREIDGLAELVIQTEGGTCALCYRPQTHAERLVEAVAGEVEQLYPEVRDEEEADLRDHMLYGGCEYRIRILISHFLAQSQLLTEQFQRVESQVGDIASWAMSRAEKEIREAQAPYGRASELIRFTRLVDELVPIWRRIREFIRSVNYDGEMLTELRNDPSFVDLSREHEPPGDLIRLALSRRRGRNVAPQALAFEHARRELGLPQAGVETLYKSYHKGRKYVEINAEGGLFFG